MPIWCHLLLQTAACVVGFLAGGLTTAVLMGSIRTGSRTADCVLISTLLIGTVFGGLRFGEWLVRRLPAGCPGCGGRAFAEGHRPIRFRCQDCETLHRTRHRTNWGDD